MIAQDGTLRKPDHLVSRATPQEVKMLDVETARNHIGGRTGSAPNALTRRPVDRGFTGQVVEAGPADTDPNVHRPRGRPDTAFTAPLRRLVDSDARASRAAMLLAVAILATTSSACLFAVVVAFVRSNTLAACIAGSVAVVGTSIVARLTRPRLRLRRSRTPDQHAEQARPGG